jgi:hypothetical protein
MRRLLRTGVVGAVAVVFFVACWMLSRQLDPPFADLFSYVAFFDRQLKPVDGKTGVAVNFAQRPLWLLKGTDRSGLNDFTVGHSA